MYYPINMSIGEYSNRSDDADKRILHAIFLDLSSALFREHIAEESYQASMAELDADLATTDIALKLRVSGFSDKSLRFAKNLLGMFLNVESYTMDEKIFERELEQLSKVLIILAIICMYINVLFYFVFFI